MSFRNKLILSFAGVYLIWGSTYLGVKFSLEGFPPLLMGGVRFTLAGILFMIFALFKGEGKLTLQDWKNGLIIGFVMNFLGQGLTFISAKHIPSSIVALICATVPLWVTFFDRMFFTRAKLSVLSYVGLLIGFIGVTNLLSPDPNANFNYLYALPILFSSSCWALGSLLPKKLNVSKSTFVNLGTQLFSGGIFFLVTSFLMGEISSFHIENVTAKSLMALSYLIIFGSIIVFSCFNWLIKNCDASKVATYGFINPLVAVMLGNLFGGEPITLKVIISASIILLGVMIIIFGKSKIKLQPKKGMKKLTYGYK